MKKFNEVFLFISSGDNLFTRASEAQPQGPQKYNRVAFSGWTPCRLHMMKNYVLLNCELWADSIGSCTSYYLRGTESTYNKSIDVHHQYIFDTETRKLYPSYEYPTWNILFVFRYP